MDISVLNRASPWITALILVILMTAATQIGFILGRRDQSLGRHGTDSQIVTIQASVLGLLGLLLGFTFSMALSRYEIRRQLVVDDANSIGTTYLRSKMLPEPHRTAVAGLLRRYVKVRADTDSIASSPEKLHQANTETQQLQNDIWSHAVAVGDLDPRAITTGLFIQTLNNMIDNHASRLEALENHVPASVLGLLYLAAILSIGLTGYAGGTTGQRNLLPNTVATIIIASVVFLIADLDRPQRGLVRVSQQSMIRLQQSLEQDSLKPTPK